MKAKAEGKKENGGKVHRTEIDVSQERMPKRYPVYTLRFGSWGYLLRFRFQGCVFHAVGANLKFPYL